MVMLLLILLFVPGLGDFGWFADYVHDCPISASMADDVDTPESPEPRVSERTWLGVRVVRDHEAAGVRRVFSGSPAHAAGLRAHDVITAVDDEPVTSPRGLRDIVASHEPGSEVTLSVRRGCKLLTIDVTLREASFVLNPSGREMPLRWPGVYDLSVER